MDFRSYVADRWVSWVLEIVVLAVIGYFTVSEARKTNELTRDILTRYDQKFSAYVSERSERLDSAVSNAKNKVSDIELEDVKSLLRNLHTDESEEPAPPPYE